MNFTIALHDVKQIVEKELQRFFSTKRSEAEKIHPQTVQLVDAIADLTSRGGKRTRAFFVWLGHEVTVKGNRKKEKGKIEDELLWAMVGIELFQSFALIHDDIIDGDSMRRGAPTVHEFFKEKGKRKKENGQNNRHFGESMAILAGDLALVWADELMGNIKNQKSKIKSYELYKKMKEEVIMGQSLDVLAANGLPSADRATINRYKTAWYSVVRPLQIGAAVAGAAKKTIDAFVPYGLAVGEGYQLRDDFLDGDIGEDAFRAQAKKLEKQTVQATQAIHAPVDTAVFLTDFVRFALARKT